MPKALASRRARATAVGEVTSAGGLEGCPEEDGRIPLAELLMLIGLLGHCSRGCLHRGLLVAGSAGNPEARRVPPQPFPNFVLAERLPSPRECCQESRCLPTGNRFPAGATVLVLRKGPGCCCKGQPHLTWWPLGG